MTTQNHEEYPVRRTCCPCGHDHSADGITCRGFLQGVGGAAALGVALTGLTWSGVSAAEREDQGELKRRPLVVKPILVYSTPKRRHQSSWRSWGGIQTQQDAEQELQRIRQELSDMENKADCQAITISGCMGTIMPIAETSACMTLCLLNDAGYMAFCESDFVVIPSGVLLVNISGRPMFLNDPTYPHDGVITLAHCTAPRKMNGKELEPVRIMTHFESDYGAAPKVEMRKGQIVTNIVPDFASKRWVGLLGEIIDAPFMDICRSQIDIRYDCDDLTLAERMPGFHWMTGYGDYMSELGYALKKVGIKWENLTA